MKCLSPVCKITWFLLFAFIATNGYCQYAGDDHLTAPDPNQTSFYSPDGKPHDTFTGVATNFNNVSNMQGFPYLIAEWVKGVVYFKNGKQYNTGDLQFDWVKNELHFKYNNRTCTFVDTVAEFLLFDTSANGVTPDFRAGYPSFGKPTKNLFYQVIKDGPKFQLLKYWSKHEREVYTYDGPYAKQYFKVEDWYMYDVKNNQLKYINLKANSVEKAFPAYAETIKKLSPENKGKRITPDELLTLVESLNNL